MRLPGCETAQDSGINCVDEDEGSFVVTDCEGSGWY